MKKKKCKNTNVYRKLKLRVYAVQAYGYYGPHVMPPRFVGNVEALLIVVVMKRSDCNFCACILVV